ncbi:MAG: DUF123 domain-containing protein [Halobacteriaceae archaeon]
MTQGTYTLLVEVTSETQVEVGALGERQFPVGTYAYTGSAFGPGGFTRLDRHREVAAGDRAVRHWHVDYLLGADATRVVGDVRTAGRDVECAVARRLAESFPPVSEFGASDCGCDSHLVVGADEAAVRGAHAAVRDA